MRRRDCFATAAAGLVVPFEPSFQPQRGPRKNWAWMRGEIQDRIVHLRQAEKVWAVER